MDLLNKASIKFIQDFIQDYFDYTTEISITESEWLSNYEWLDEWYKWVETTDKENCEEIMRKLYHKEALKDLLYDLIFEQDKIKEQLENDIEDYGENSIEFRYIKEFYNKWKTLFDFRIKELEG